MEMVAWWEGKRIYQFHAIFNANMEYTHYIGSGSDFFDANVHLYLHGHFMKFDQPPYSSDMVHLYLSALYFWELLMIIIMLIFPILNSRDHPRVKCSDRLRLSSIRLLLSSPKFLLPRQTPAPAQAPLLLPARGMQK